MGKPVCVYLANGSVKWTVFIKGDLTISIIILNVFIVSPSRLYHRETLILLQAGMYKMLREALFIAHKNWK